MKLMPPTVKQAKNITFHTFLDDKFVYVIDKTRMFGI